MKGPNLDDRLEAIAGTPVARWYGGAPLRIPAQNGYTFVWVALGPAESGYLTDSGAPRHYVTSYYGDARTLPGLKVTTLPGGSSLTYAGLDSPLNVGMGARHNLTEPWESPHPAACVLYPGPLTDYQTQRVIAYLTRQLRH